MFIIIFRAFPDRISRCLLFVVREIISCSRKLCPVFSRLDGKSITPDRNADEVSGAPKIPLPPRSHVGRSSGVARDMSHTRGSQWRSMARASSIRSTGSNISPTGVAGGTWTGLNPARRTLSIVNRASHQPTPIRLAVQKRRSLPLAR